MWHESNNSTELIVVHSLPLYVDNNIFVNANIAADSWHCDASQWESSAKISAWSRISHRSGEILLFHHVSFICGEFNDHVADSVRRHYLHSVRAAWLQFILSHWVNTFLIFITVYVIKLSLLLFIFLL